MSALDRLNTLQNQLEVLERNSTSSSGHSISTENIKSIRKSVNQLSHDLKEELKYTRQYHESYRPSVQPAAPPNETINTEEKSAVNEHDDETFAWLDDNYGGIDESVLLSPKRTPLERFKVFGNLLKTEIKECRRYGLDTRNMRGLGWARMSVAVNSSSMLTQMIFAVPAVEKLLHTCWNLDEFDIFQFAAMPELRGHVLLVFASYLSKQFDFITSYNIPKDKFHNFLIAIEQNYNNVPYHSKIHAADVVHTMMCFCKHAILTEHMTVLDILAAFIAAIIHDVGHTGQTNSFHINSSSTLAIRYNDRSVLEQYHISTAFQLLRDPKHSFLETLTKKEYKYVRDTIIELVLGTDMFRHQEQLGKLKQFTNIIKRQNENILDLQIFTNGSIPRIRGVLNEKRFLMEIALHLSDISNPIKKLSVSIEWTKRITQEFFAQGDMERRLKLPISPGCDRTANANMAKQSIAFIDFIVFPMYTAYNILDKEASRFIQSIKQSREYWQSKM